MNEKVPKAIESGKDNSSNIGRIKNQICLIIAAAFFWIASPLFWIASPPAWLLTTLPVVVIVLAVVADLASVGSRIAVEKDWIVVIADNDNDQLARYPVSKKCHVWSW